MSILLLLTTNDVELSDPFKFLRHEESLPGIFFLIFFFTLKRELKEGITLSSWIGRT